MLIGEIVRQTGVSRDTIRYYERLGLLQAEGRPPPFNTYEAYPAATVTQLGLIQQAKKLGFSLSEIAELFTLWEARQLLEADLQARIQEKLAVIAEKIQQLKVIRTNLLQCLIQPPTSCCP
jgi:MerR family copper efflux transcriptional regulator